MGHARQLIESLVAEASQCCAQVRGGSVCTRNAVAWRSGQPYCYAHDPDRSHLSVPVAQDRRRKVRWTAEGILSEIALAPEFGGDVEPVDADQGHDWAQEKLWFEIAAQAGLSNNDLKAAGAEHGLSTPQIAIDAAYADDGFPRRGSWSGELVWLFLALRDRGLIDAEGSPT